MASTRSIMASSFIYAPSSSTASLLSPQPSRLAFLPNSSSFSSNLSLNISHHRRRTIANTAVKSTPYRPTILVSKKLGEAGLDLLLGFGDVECSYGLSPEQLRRKISSCDALIVRSGTKAGPPNRVSWQVLQHRASKFLG